MQNSAGPSGQPCCVPSTEAKSAHVASVARGALGPRRAQTKGRRRRIGGGASARRCVRRALSGPFFLGGAAETFIKGTHHKRKFQQWGCWAHSQGRGDVRGVGVVRWRPDGSGCQGGVGASRGAKQAGPGPGRRAQCSAVKALSGQRPSLRLRSE
jgi:hypothetical protein